LSDALLLQASRETHIELLAKRLSGTPIASGQPLAKRLNLAVESLNQMNYHAHWEAGSEGPRMVFGHCPYAAIIARHPELCAMDQAILREVTGESAVQISKTGQEGSSVCVFVLGRVSLP
jgi:predicted ArsR family transcriptional regulator